MYTNLPHAFSAFNDALTTPINKAGKKTSKNAKRTLFMPKHMTGDAFIEMMEEKRKAQEEETKMKEQRKLKREQKKEEHQRLKEQKEKERQKKKEDFAKRRQEKEAEAEKKKVQREQKRLEMAEQKAKKEEEKKKRKEVAAQKRKEKEKMGKRKGTKVVQPLEFCGRCGFSEADDIDLQWVACDNCEKWWHIVCTENSMLSIEDFSNITWQCINCRKGGTK